MTRLAYIDHGIVILYRYVAKLYYDLFISDDTDEVHSVIKEPFGYFYITEIRGDVRSYLCAGQCTVDCIGSDNLGELGYTRIL